jgi:hypothetical protein
MTLKGLRGHSDCARLRALTRVNAVQENHYLQSKLYARRRAQSTFFLVLAQSRLFSVSRFQAYGPDYVRNRAYAKFCASPRLDVVHAFTVWRRQRNVIHAG